MHPSYISQGRVRNDTLPGAFDVNASYVWSNYVPKTFPGTHFPEPFPIPFDRDFTR